MILELRLSTVSSYVLSDLPGFTMITPSGVDKGGVQGVRTPPRAHPYTFTTE
jgi:hypothetical protein